MPLLQLVSPSISYTIESLKAMIAASLNVTEPASTGAGGDMFCLYFDAKTKTVHALNGSGRSPKNTTLAQIKEELGMSSFTKGKIPINSALAVTVPGAPAGWLDAIERFGSGKVSVEEILMPAIELGENGFPVSEISAKMVRPPPVMPHLDIFPDPY